VNRTFHDYVGVGSILACVAGIVNAVGFIGFGGFVTHVSGNATRAAVEYSEGHYLIASVFLVGILFFVSGALTTTLLLRGHSIESSKASFGIPVLIEAALIGLVAWFGSRHVAAGQTLEISRIRDTWYLNALTFAMGMQNAIIRQASGIIVRTTHMTGIVTDLGIAMGTVISRLSSEVLKNPSGFMWRQGRESVDSGIKDRFSEIFRRFHLERFFLHISLLFSFLCGAALGTFGYLSFGLRILLGPLFVLAGLGLFEMVVWKKRRAVRG
jgi:uncharacterized membrane protein YoaK (UPF0700 family)